MPSRERFENLIAAGTLTIGERDVAAISPHPSGHIFRVAVGVTGHSVSPDWDAFEQRYQWFSRRPQTLMSGAHLFVLAVDRWRSAVVGLYEAVSSGAEELPGSSDPVRWPWALGVRPLAAIPPPDAERVEGQIGPQSGLPARITDPDARERLYRAVAASPPPPGPRTPEQRVQELEWQDVAADVLDAVGDLGREAHHDAVVARAIEIGEWSDRDLEARAWYTGSGVGSHVENIVRRALRFEVGSKGNLRQLHGVYSLAPTAPVSVFGAPYRHAAGRRLGAPDEMPEHLADLAELDRATRRHMDLQDGLADALQERDLDARSPSTGPQFDLAFDHDGKRFLVEVKSGDPVSNQQVRLGVGQLLEYRHQLMADAGPEIQAVLLVESAPPAPWEALAGELGIEILRNDRLEESLDGLLRARH